MTAPPQPPPDRIRFSSFHFHPLRTYNYIPPFSPSTFHLVDRGAARFLRCRSLWWVLTPSIGYSNYPRRNCLVFLVSYPYRVPISSLAHLSRRSCSCLVLFYLIVDPTPPVYPIQSRIHSLACHRTSSRISIYHPRHPSIYPPTLPTEPLSSLLFCSSILLYVVVLLTAFAIEDPLFITRLIFSWSWFTLLTAEFVSFSHPRWWNLLYRAMSYIPFKFPIHTCLYHYLIHPVMHLPRPGSFHPSILKSQSYYKHTCNPIHRISSPSISCTLPLL